MEKEIMSKRVMLNGKLLSLWAVALFLLTFACWQPLKTQAQWTSNSGNTTTPDNVAIGTTDPAGFKLKVNGDFDSNSYKVFQVTRTLPALNSTVFIGTFNVSTAMSSLTIDITVAGGGIGVTKHYVIPVGWVGGNNVNPTSWWTVAPFSHGGSYAGEDFNLEIYNYGGTVMLRLRPTSDGMYGMANRTAYITVKESHVNASYFSPQPPSWEPPAMTAYSDNSVAGIYKATQITQIESKVGIGTISPAYKLDVAGPIRSTSGGFIFPDGTVQTTAYSAGGTQTQWVSITGGGIYYNGGNVGIGTNDPSLQGRVGSKFTIAQSDGSTALAIGNTAGVPRFALNGNTDGSWTLYDFASGNWSAGITQKAGNVGVGTQSPVTNFHVVGNISLDAAGNKYYFAKNGSNPDTNWSLGYGGTLGGTLVNTAGVVQTIYGGAGAFGYMIKNSSGTSLFEIQGSTGTTYLAGNVGIGTPTPAAKLDVNGDTKVTGKITATGDITTDGTIYAKYQDVAEWVPSTRELPAGTVVILNPSKSNEVMASTQAYDTRVAGVVSERPGLTLGEAGSNKSLVATTGRVRVKVDATRTPIRIGDLLVTSDVEGVAMKSEPLEFGGVKMHRPGTIIGKALEPLEKGKGEILVLLSLQ